jgi:hypothetical protein
MTDSLLREAVQVWKEFLIDEIPEIVAGHGGVVIDLPILTLGGSQTFPAIWLIENVGVFLASSCASVALSCTNPSRYLRKRAKRSVWCNPARWYSQLLSGERRRYF